MRGDVCQLLEEDPGLAVDLDEDRRRAAIQRVLARVMHLATSDGNRLAAGAVLPRPAGVRGAGFLVLEGHLLRRVGMRGRFGAEMLGAGDLLRPWQGEDDEPTLDPEAAWRVLEPTRLAVLDARFLARLGPYPEVSGRLVERALKRSRHLAIQMAIVHQPRLEARLHMLFWQLAGRWGRVGPDGVSLSLRLSHSMLAELVAARRPSVTTALSRLAADGLVVHDGDRWLLRGGPPAELTEMGAIATDELGGASALT